MIKIKKIVLNNYRQYSGRQNILFNQQKDKNLHIFMGVNGAGKTNLMNALTWCLYGSEEHLSQSSIHHNMLNDNIRETMKKGSTNNVFVEVSFEDQNGCEFKIHRSMEFKKNSNGSVSALREESLAYIKKRNKQDWDSVEIEFIVNNRILPKGVKDFFFFDGEKLIKFFEEETAEKVKSAIIDVSQISLIDTTISHLKNKKDDLLKDAESASPKAKEISDEINSYSGGLKDIERDLEKEIQNKKDFDYLIKEINDKLSGYSEERVKELQNNYNEINEQINDLQTEIDDLEDIFNKLLLDKGSIVLSSKAIAFSKELINKAYEKGDLPPPATEDFIRELLEKGKCICGTDISKGTSRRNVEEFLNKSSTFATELDKQCGEIKPFLKIFANFESDFIKEKIKLGKDIFQKTKKIDKLKEQEQGITIKLRELKNKKIDSLLEQRESYEKSKDETISSITLLKDRKDRSDRLIRCRVSELKKEIKKKQKFDKLTKRITLVDKSIVLLENIKKEILEEVRTTVEDTTFKYFHELIWKKKKFNKIKIDNDYMLSLIDRYGHNIVGVISAGEKEILALAFMAALRKISGFEAPIAIDTLLGRISKQHRINIANSVPKYLKDTQILLLFTDEEYNDKVEYILNSRVSDRYRLDYNDKNDMTEVKKW